MKANKLNLDSFRTCSLSTLAQYQCMGVGKYVHLEPNNQYGPRIGAGGPDTKTIVQATGPGISQLAAGIDYKGCSITTQPFRKQPNASIKLESKCWLS